MKTPKEIRLLHIATRDEDLIEQIDHAIYAAQKEAKAEGIREMFAAVGGFFKALENQRNDLLNKTHGKIF